MAKYLSNRVRNFNIGVSGITESDTVLTTIGNTDFTGKVDIDIGSGTSAFEIQGSVGQLFSVTNNLTSGSIFSVNDVSGIPSIDVDADGTILLAPYGVTEFVGVGITSPQQKLHLDAGTLLVTNTTAPQIRLSADNTDASDNDRTMLGQVTGANNFVNNSTINDTVLRGTSSGSILFGVGTSEKLRIASAGQLGLGGANYGTSGQVITSNGSSSAPTWEDANATTIIVADESTDTTCFPLFATNATGSISPKTGSNFAFNSNTGTLKLTSAGNAITINNTLVDIVDIGNDSGAFAINAGGNVNTMIVKSGGTERLQINSSGAEVTGVMTATTFSGSGSSLTDLTGASAATYGDGSNVAQIVVDANGRITGISNVAISGGGGGGGVTVQDEGNPLSTTATTLNFVGSGVVASGTGATKTITISGEGVASVTAADESSDTTCFPLFATSATGSVAAKTDASGLKYDSSNERLETTDVAVKGAVRYENSGSTERFEILYNETTDSLDFTYSAS